MHTRSTLVALSLLVLASCPRPGAPPTSSASDAALHAPAVDADAPLPFDPEVRRGRLDNGLTFLVAPHSEPPGRVELRLAVKAGSVVEDDDQRGIAHFVEHMAFNGTEHFPGTELDRVLEALGIESGAHLNAYTGFDETVYQLQVSADDDMLETGMTVLRDWAGELVFDAEEVEKERGVVIEEWRLGRDADSRVWNAVYAVQFGGSRYAERLPIGDPESLRACDQDTLRRFYADWYRPDLMALVVAGDVDADDIERRIRLRFDDLPAAETPRPRTWDAAPVDPEPRVVGSRGRSGTARRGGVSALPRGGGRSRGFRPRV